MKQKQEQKYNTNKNTEKKITICKINELLIYLCFDWILAKSCWSAWIFSMSYVQTRTSEK